MSCLAIGSAAPDFTLTADDGRSVSLRDFAGKRVVLYFYPKDDTPGCTQESCDFRDTLSDFSALDAGVLGVSKDSLKSHGAFRDKYGLTFPLLSDPDGAVCAAYGVWAEKSMYGKKYFGIERSTFLIGADGKILALWRKVSVPGHVAAVRAALQAA